MGKFHVERYERRFQRQVSSALDTTSRVVDVGRGEQYGEDQVASYRVSTPADTDRLTLDVRSETHPTFVGDLANLPLASESVGVAFCESVLEHVEPISNLNDCVDELHRVLVDGGVVAGWVPFCFHFHGWGNFPDGTRFTYDGVERLLSEFDDVSIQPCGGPVSVLLDSLRRVGYALRRRGVERIETKFRYRLFCDSPGLLAFGGDPEAHKWELNSVGFRFFARK